MSGTVGIVVNPHAGKDIRRLVSHASPTTDAAKIGVVRRTIVGALEAGATRIVLVPDAKGLADTALAELPAWVRACSEVLDLPAIGRSSDTIEGAQALASAGVGAVVVLGGDGTHRDVAKGWLSAPIVALSTGTNNVFPRFTEATVAGMAAGLVASKQVRLHDAALAAKVIHVQIENEADDLALVDVALVAGAFVGSRAVWDSTLLQAVLAVIAEPANVGLSAIVALLHPVGRNEKGGAIAYMGSPGWTVRAPVAPGAFTDAAVRSLRVVAEHETVELQGPGVLTFDGERDRVLRDGQRAYLRIRRDGPMVIDVDNTMKLAVAAGRFRQSSTTAPGSPSTSPAATPVSGVPLSSTPSKEHV